MSYKGAAIIAVGKNTNSGTVFLGTDFGFIRKDYLDNPY
jgi:hypothetical protein